MKQKNVLVMLALVTVSLFGCATPIPVNSTLSDLVLVNVKTNSRDNVSYKFTSKLTPEHTVKMGGLNPVSNANATYSAMLNNYMESKFSKIGNKGINISVQLVSLDCEQKMPPGFGGALAALSSSGAEAIASAKVAVRVSVVKSGKEIGQKNIQAFAEENYRTGGPEDMSIIYARTINKANNKSLAMINSYLASIDL